MILETGREVQKLTGNLQGYLGVLGLSPRTYGYWAREYAGGTLVERPPAPPSQERQRMLALLRSRMKSLAHRRHYTYGLAPLWSEYRGQLTREEFRQLAREVHAEVKRERRNKIQRYEFLFPDVAHSIDFKGMPREYPGAAKRYLIRILDECTRFTLRKAITEHKGAGVGMAFVQGCLKGGRPPLLYKYDWEFAVDPFENLLLSHKIVPLPSPRDYPQHNGAFERTNRDVQMWFESFAGDQFWSYDEVSKETDICFEQLDEIEERAMFGGRTRRQAYEQMKRADVDRNVFFEAVVAYRRAILQRPGAKVHPTDAWRYAAKETLKQFNLVRYSRP